MKILNLNVKECDIKVVFENSKSLEVVSLKLVFKVAGAYMDSKNGLARLTANMLNEGDSKLGSYGFAKELEKRAIELHVSAGFETFSIELNSLKEHFNFAIFMLKNLLISPNLSEESLKKCKNITLGEIANSQNDNDYLAKCGLMSILYPNTNLQNPSIGTEKSINSINLEDIKEFIAKNLDLANLFVVFGGDVSEAELESIKDAVSVLNVGGKRELEKLKTSEKMSEKEILKPSEQAYIYFGSPYNVNDNERYIASVATYVLGEGGFGSRLMEEVRVKRGLAYSAYAKNMINLSHSQIFGYLQTKNESKDDAIAVVKDEFDKFAKNGVSKKELEQAKNFLLGSLPLRLETLFRRLSIAEGEFYHGKELGAFLKELDKINALKLNDLNDFISSHDEITRLSFCVLRDKK